MYDKKENNFKKKGLCVSLCAALVCGLGIGGVYYKMNKAPQSDGTKLFQTHRQVQNQQIQMIKKKHRQIKKTMQQTKILKIKQ